MSDQHDEAVDHLDAVSPDEAVAGVGADDAGQDVPGAGREPTGHDEVDEIIGGLGRLDGLEVHDHVAEFENAHQALRRALDAGGQ